MSPPERHILGDDEKVGKHFMSFATRPMFNESLTQLIKFLCYHHDGILKDTTELFCYNRYTSTVVFFC